MKDKETKQKEKIAKFVKKIIKKRFKLHIKDNDFPKENMVKQLGLDSIGIFECFVLLENKYDVDFSSDNLFSIDIFDSIDKIVERIYSLLNEKSAS